MAFHPVIPILRIFDEARAREFYLDFLGFQIEFEHRFAPDLPLYMGIVRETCRIHLSEHSGDGSPGVTVRIECDEVDDYQRALVAKQSKYCRPGISDTDWGMREMRVKDAFGNTLVFYRRMG